MAESGTPKGLLIPSERIEKAILLIRGCKVLLDSDLAALYEVETKQLVRAVKRNIDRFPGDFSFQLTQQEFLGRTAHATVGIHRTRRGHVVERVAQQAGRPGEYRDYAHVYAVAGIARDSCPTRPAVGRPGPAGMLRATARMTNARKKTRNRRLVVRVGRGIRQAVRSRVRCNVVVECKSPKVKDAIPEAIDQLMRYSEQRGAKGEGSQPLFFYNQFVVATCRNECKFGTISTHTEKYFYRWADPYPRTIDELEHGASVPNDQQRLVARMLDHDNLLDLIRTFTMFATNEKGQTIKIVGRYQQFRAVKLAVKRLLDGKTPRERSGIIWHTQRSGKSLTMMFMVREMYRHADRQDRTRL